MKKRAIRVAVVMIALGLCLAAAALCTVKFDFSRLVKAELTTETVSVTETFDRVEIDVSDADVTISAGSLCQVTYQKDEGETFEIAAEGGVLRIKQGSEVPWYRNLFRLRKRMPVTVQLPAGEYAALRVKSRSGDILVGESLSFAEADLTASSGNVTWNGGAGRLSAVTTSGNVRVFGMRGGAAMEELSLVSTSGNVRVMGIDAGALDVTTTSGDAELQSVTCADADVQTTSGEAELDNVAASGVLRVTTTSGDIELEYCDGGELFLQSVSGDIDGGLRTPKLFDVKTTSGEVEIPPMRTGAEAICHAVTTSGDIELEIGD